MKNFNLLVANIEPNDKEKLMAKAFVASKILRILAVMAVVITLLIVVPIIIGGGILSGTAVEISDVEGGTATAITGGAMAFSAGMMLLLVGMVGQFITL